MRISKIGLLVISCLIVFMTLVGQAQANTEIKVKIDGENVNFPDMKPYVNSDNRTMVPIRFISDDMGYGLSWNQETKVVEIDSSGTKVILKVGEKIVQVGSSTIAMDTEAVIREGRTFVPLRFVTQAFDVKIAWNQSTQTISMEMPSVGQFHIVERGDTLYSISTKYNVSVENIKKFNKMTDNIIHVGQKLMLADATYYVVKSGDTLYKISQQFGVSVNEIKQANALTSDALYVGQELRIDNPKTGTAPPTTTTPDKEVVSPTKTGTVTATQLNVRKSASSSAAIVGSVYNGNVVTIKSTQGEWHQIEYKGLVGWSHGSYISINQNNVLKGKIIVVDPGHGGVDTGAMALDRKTKESTLVLQYSMDIKRELESTGATVVMTRQTDVSCHSQGSGSVELACRAKFSETHNADIFISVHANSYSDGSVRGTETFYSTSNPYPTESKLLATLIHNNVQPVVASANRGVKTANYYVNKNNVAPSVLLEIGFLTNSYDFGRMQQASVRTQFASKTKDAVVKYFE